MSGLDKRIEQELRAAFDSLERSGELLSVVRLQAAYAGFRERFGPDKLNSLDGQALLQAMHTHGNRESLVYWLEFKNDEEFPGTKLGSIAGGSAHKFGFFRRKDTGQWVTGGPISRKTISETEAVSVARKHRDQLFAGISRCLKNCPTTRVSTNTIGSFKNKLMKPLPIIVAWLCGHKYFESSIRVRVPQADTSSPQSKLSALQSDQIADLLLREWVILT